MRITVIGPTYPIKGGISHYSTLLVRELRKSHDTLFISYRYQYPELIYPGKGQKKEDKNPIREEAEYLWHTLQPWTLNRIARRIREHKSEAVVMMWHTHFFGWHIAKLAKLIRKSTGCPVILICHNVKQHESKPLEGQLTRKAYNAVDGFIVHSDEDMENLKAIRPDALVRKNFAPTFDVFATSTGWTRDKARKELGLTDEPMVLYFGLVRKYKGLKWLIEASPGIIENVPGAQIWCVGEYWDGPDEYENWAKELNTLFNPGNSSKGGVRIIDSYVPNDEVGKYFAAADVMVLPYESATQSAILQIAYGFKLPCIVTNVGGLPEVVRDHLTGFVIPPRDPSAIIRTVTEYFQRGSELRSKMEREITEWRKVFEWNHMVQTIGNLVDDISS